MIFRPTDVPAPGEGKLTTVEVDGVTVAVARVGGRLHAFQDGCTHMQCSLSDGDLEGTSIICPCHLGRFDVTTGAVLDGPPPAPLRTWRVRADRGRVEVEVAPAPAVEA
jgi:nitrite reductase/ring-hydroxylating ferredoxin subunit